MNTVCVVKELRNTDQHSIITAQIYCLDALTHRVQDVIQKAIIELTSSNCKQGLHMVAVFQRFMHLEVDVYDNENKELHTGTNICGASVSAFGVPSIKFSVSPIMDLQQVLVTTCHVCVECLSF